MSSDAPAHENELIKALGPGLPVVSSDTPEVRQVWTVAHVEVASTALVNDRRLRALWGKRKGNRATPLLLVAPVRDGTVRVLGPQRADDPIREIRVDSLLHALRDLEGKSRRDAVAALAAALDRLDRSGIPGLVVRGLLTKHLLTRRLRRDHPSEWVQLQEAAAKVRPGATWRENFTALGYRVEERKTRGYVLRAVGDERPVAVVHPLPDPAAFSKMTVEGSPPEGLLIADCRNENVRWGLLATDDRFRLFPAETAVGAATARYLEMDLISTEPDDWVYIGLLSPKSLTPGGLLEQLVLEAHDLGNELRDSIERQIREQVLPAIARGLGEYERSLGHDLSSPEVRKLLEDGSLLLLFRLLFFLYLESRGYLPLSSAAYRPHSATSLVQEARAQAGSFEDRATTFWDRSITLLNVMRSGRTVWGVPPYNGDLFASDVLEGAELLEEAHLTDSFFGPALAALGFAPEGEDAQAGVDYGDLEIAHLGRIYEGLLSLRLSVASEPLAYDTRTDRWMPAGRQAPEIRAGDLFFQSESGGRKAAGVYYTPQVIVRHLVDHAVLPALQEHLQQVAEAAQRNVEEAAIRLFDFRILDPAMGSAHFLADALDRVSERIATFLAEYPLKPVARLLDELRAEAKWEGRIEDGELLRRLVLKRCIYGVDLSRMAVEVGKVTLWLAAFVPGLSLAYLGHNLRQGDALIGVADRNVLADLGPFFAEYEDSPIPRALARAEEVARRVADTADRTPDEVEVSQKTEAEMEEVTAGLARVFDVWCSEPFRHRGARGWLIGYAEKLIDGDIAGLKGEHLEAADREAQDRYFFHWPLMFPEVFARDRPGFDVVIGNPPWEEVNLAELWFYALHDPGIRGLSNESERRQRINLLDMQFPTLREEFSRRRVELDTRRRFFRPEGGYFAQGVGDTDTYKLFSERYRSLTRTRGWLGVVLPRSAFLVDGARGFRRWLFEEAQVWRLDFILNSARWAFDMEPRYTIALMAAQRTKPGDSSVTRLTGPSSSLAQFQAATLARGIPVLRQQLQAWTAQEAGPGFEVPLLPRPEAVVVFDRMRSGPTFEQGYVGIWSAFPVAELHETADKRLFRYQEGVPVWKGRSLVSTSPTARSRPATHARPKL